MSQKICIISFDHWNYDKHIVQKLQEKGIDAFHIKIGAFKYKNILERVFNTLSKIFLRKNPKIKKRQDYILNTLKEKGFQNQILVINPEVIHLEYHLAIKKYTSKYIAYLYDSVQRCPIEHLINGIFDEIYSFDTEDVKKYNFKKITNYIYWQQQPIIPDFKPKNQVLYIASFDKRLHKVQLLKNSFNELDISYLFLIIGKKTTLFKLQNMFSNKFENLQLRRNRINEQELQQLYSETQIVLDIVRENQTGLSFRIFEAMAYQKKIITNNKYIKEHNFYNPNNILVIDDGNYVFDSDFFSTNYEPISQEIYNQYTLDTWVKTVFGV